MRHLAFPQGLSRETLLDWYRAARARSREIFDFVEPAAYYDRPIPLRNPIVFYEGHLPGFSVNTLVKLAHRRAGVDERLEALFARGIDPEDEGGVKNTAAVWPSRDEVHRFAERCDALVEDALGSLPLEDDGVPQLRGGEAVLTILEHELMHQETLLYMLHQLDHSMKRKRPALNPAVTANTPRPRREMVRIPAGRVAMGMERGTAFGWDNEFPRAFANVAEFSIDNLDVTNGDYLEFIESTGARAPHFWARIGDGWYWRGMFENVPLPLDAPVYATHDEAVAFLRWKGKRLPTEAEFHRAAFGTPQGEERLHPWGDTLPDATRGHFDFASFDPVAAGSHPAGASAWGVHDLVGNGWEWTSTPFAGFPGFEAMPSYPQYSSDFFDDAHFVMKGASPVTARELIRPSFRNWFRPAYPWVYATFRGAHS
jgi:iron(II)-dependent oxidoreductase